MTNWLKQFLQMTKLTADTISSILPWIKTLLVAAVAFVIAMVISSDVFGKKEEEYLAQMREFKKEAQRASQYADSMAVQVARQDSISREARARASEAQRRADQSRNQAATLTRGLDSLRATISDSTEMARVIIPKQDSLIQQQRVTIVHQDTTIQNLERVVVSQDTSILLLTASRDSLQRVVNAIPTPPSPPIFPRISRTRALVGGVLIGMVVKTVISK